jgi:hypothetical protein
VFEDLGLTRPVANYNLTEVSPNGSRRAGHCERLSTLRVRPVIGRAHTEEEQLDAGRASSVAVLSYSLWQRRFGGDPSVVGRTILLNGSPYQVVGVMGADFQYPDRDFELWTPLYIPPDQLRERRDYSYLCVARVKAGVTLEQARAHMNVLAANLARGYPQTNQFRRFVEPMLNDMTARSATHFSCCCGSRNPVSGGLRQPGESPPGQGNEPSPEFSLRASLGATRPRLARQFFAERFRWRSPAPVSASCRRIGCCGS